MPLQDFAIFLARDANLGVDAGGRFFKRERHVIAEIGAALHASAATAAAATAEKILEAEEVAENIVEILKDGVR